VNYSKTSHVSVLLDSDAMTMKSTVLCMKQYVKHCHHLRLK
jgi:hypothetical protein